MTRVQDNDANSLQKYKSRNTLISYCSVTRSNQSCPGCQICLGDSRVHRAVIALIQSLRVSLRVALIGAVFMLVLGTVLVVFAKITHTAGGMAHLR